MNTAQSEDAVWKQRQQSQKEHKAGVRKQKPWQVLLVIAYLLIGAGLWGVLSIYGPVLAAEVGYQLRAANIIGEDGGLLSFIVPRWRFNLDSMAFLEGMGMVIPKIYMREPIVMNVDANNRTAYKAALNEGVAHAAGTGLPGQGALGYYFAHSSGMNVLAPQKNAMFYLLGKLETGDEVYVYRSGVKFTYLVTESRVTDADDLSFLEGEYMDETIVLQTCWPIGTSLQRLLVFGKLVG
jgi:LPXTG-site transpeptidase (sortase) family protein